MNNVIFLDIDGVLNSNDWYHKRQKLTTADETWSFLSRNLNEFDPIAVGRLQFIIHETNAKLVLSSSWRRLHSLDEISEFLGQISTWDNERWRELFIGATPCHHDGFRGHEIDAWMEEHHASVRKFVIIDDDSDFTEKQKPFFVHTTWKDGLTDSDVHKAIAILT